MRYVNVALLSKLAHLALVMLKIAVGSCLLIHSKSVPICLLTSSSRSNQPYLSRFLCNDLTPFIPLLVVHDSVHYL